jgi:hypothetical protein
MWDFLQVFFVCYRKCHIFIPASRRRIFGLAAAADEPFGLADLAG